MHTQTDAGQSDPYVPLCFAGDTKRFVHTSLTLHAAGVGWGQNVRHKYFCLNRTLLPWKGKSKLYVSQTHLFFLLFSSITCIYKL